MNSNARRTEAEVEKKAKEMRRKERKEKTSDDFHRDMS